MLNEIDLSRIDLNLLVLFEAVMEERHVGRTAQRMNLSPSAISHGLGRLRRMLNDPLFLKTPTGVLATARAEALSDGISEALARIRKIVADAAPFDPATSARRFIIGAPDGVTAVFLRFLLAELAKVGPGIAIGVRHLLPSAGEAGTARVWHAAFNDLETRAADVVVIPSDDIPPRFAVRPMYEEDFVIGMRSRHPLEPGLTLATYAAAEHLVVSASGDPLGFVDEFLAHEGLSRRVKLTVPNFTFAAAILAETDLICAFPRRFAADFAHQMGIQVVEPPLALAKSRLNMVTLRSARDDAGLSWILDVLSRAAEGNGATG